MADTATSPDSGGEDVERRDFLILAAGAMGIVGAGSVVWPLIDSMNPSAEVLALSTVEVNLGRRVHGIDQRLRSSGRASRSLSGTAPKRKLPRRGM